MSVCATQPIKFEWIHLPKPEQPSISLDLKGSREFPRRLNIVLGSVFSVAMYPPNYRPGVHPMLAFASCELSHCRVYGAPNPAIWLGSASFDLSAAELKKVAEKFGLTVRQCA